VVRDTGGDEHEQACMFGLFVEHTPPTLPPSEMAAHSGHEPEEKGATFLPDQKRTARAAFFFSVACGASAKIRHGDRSGSSRYMALGFLERQPLRANSHHFYPGNNTRRPSQPGLPSLSLSLCVCLIAMPLAAAFEGGGCLDSVRSTPRLKWLHMQSDFRRTSKQPSTRPFAE